MYPNRFSRRSLKSARRATFEFEIDIWNQLTNVSGGWLKLGSDHRKNNKSRVQGLGPPSEPVDYLVAQPTGPFRTWRRRGLEPPARGQPTEAITELPGRTRFEAGVMPDLRKFIHDDPLVRHL